MKLHSITLHNIKSLTGPYSLNLDERFGDSELFLIHGPTGVGKTSIFDAVALSLFGQTPKLNGGAQGEGTNSVGWVMNELSGECWTELVFSILEPTGERLYYQARWELHRSGRKPRGAIQQVRRKLNRLDCDFQFVDVLVDSKTAREYDAAFEKALLGMTYSDFQQTVLLPQNGFAHFIEAAQKERTILLERLTGTGHLAKLCARADERRKRCRDQRQTEEALLVGVLSESEVATTKHTLEIKEIELSAFTLAQKVLVMGQDWDHHVQSSEQQEVARLTNLRAKQDLLLEIEKERAALEVLTNEGQCLEQDLNTLREQRVGVEERLGGIGQSVSILVQKREELFQLKRRVEERSSEIRRIEQQLNRTAGVSSEELIEVESRQQRLLETLTLHLSNVTLDDYVIKINSRKKILRHQSQSLGTYITLLHRQKQLEDSKITLEQDIEREVSQIALNQTSIMELNQQITIQSQHLEQLKQRLEKAKEFFVWHNERSKLESGKACVLCGSTEHPYHHHTTDDNFELAKQKQSEIEQHYRNVEREIDRLKNQVIELQTRNRIKESTLKRSKNDLSVMTRNWQEQHTEMGRIAMDVIQSEQGFTEEEAVGIKNEVEATCDQLDVLMDSLNTTQIQLTRLLQAQTQQQELINQKQTLLLQQDAENNQLVILEKEINEGASEEQTKLEELTCEINQLTKSNCAQKNKLNEMIQFLQSHIVTVLDNWSRQYSDWTNRRTQLQTSIETKNQSIERRNQELLEIEQHQHTLQTQLIVKKEALQEGLVAMEELPIQLFDMDSDWSERWQVLKDSRTFIFEQRANCEQSIQTLKKQLQVYQDNIERMRRIDQLKQEEQQWSDMHILLNTDRHVVKDPKGGMSVNFRKYAQIRQLQLLVEGANEHLTAMQTEYFLTIRTDSDGRPMLDFEVKMDSQFSRPLTTLSGGQTFIVSLAFALALADLRKIDLQIETLLIDEGFGALDRNYVEMAVDTLGQLKHKGVQVGLISHVVALQEKIPAAVTIEDLELGVEV